VRWISAVALAVLTLVVTGCGSDESDSEKALNQVCDARADIQKQVNELSNLTAATITVDGVKANVSAIQKDLGEIEDAQDELDDQRKKEVQSANDAFSSQVQSIVNDLGTSLSISGAKSQLQSALQQLANSYEQTLASISCP
jgi:chromosome segregation ATPase